MITTTTQTAPAAPTNIRVCLQCGTPYDWRRSTSGSLKMTYCSVLCEKASLGFTIEALIATRRETVEEREAREEREEREPELVAA